MITLAGKLGMPGHHSLLLRKAAQFGLRGTSGLIGLAVARGCQHYQGGPEPVLSLPPSRATFSDEELAIALLSPCLPYSTRAVRVGAQMLGSRGNQAQRLALLARRERAEAVVRHVATAGQQTEPQELFWSELLAALPPTPSRCMAIQAGTLPHPSRFRLETGRTRLIDPGRGDARSTWLRPVASPSATTA